MNFYENIEDYCDGLLDDEHIYLFKKAMKEDSELHLKVTQYNEAKSISEGLLEIDVMEIIQSLQKKGSHQDQNKKSTIRVHKGSKGSFVKLAIAASFIGLLGALGWWIMGNSQAMDSELWNSYYVRPIDPDATKSGDIKLMTSFELGKYYFSLNEFEKSEKQLQETLKTEQNKKTSSKVYYWLGHVYMNQSKWDKSIEVFQMSDEEMVRRNVELCEKMR